MELGDWTLLEVATLVASIATPVAVAYFGWRFGRALKTIEHQQWGNRKVIERRLQLYEEMAPDLNRLLCFFTFVGDFRSVTPVRAIALKRDLDGRFYVFRFLMDGAFSEAYTAFMDACFRQSAVPGKDALIRSAVSAQRMERGPEHWDDGWVALFCEPEGATPRDGLRSAYEHLMGVFADNVGLRGPTRAASEGEHP